MAKSKKNTVKKLAKGIELPEGVFKMAIDFQESESVSTVFANNMVVQQDSSSFYLSFFELLPPMLLGSPEEVKKKLLASGSLKAKCVARVVVPLEKMADFATALAVNFGKNPALSNKPPEGNEKSNGSN